MEWLQHFDRVFEHLGEPASYTPKNAIAPIQELTVLVRAPENYYEVGSSEVIGQIAELVFRVNDIPHPHLGDKITVRNCIYKFHEEPLLDASNLLWRVGAILSVRGTV